MEEFWVPACKRPRLFMSLICDRKQPHGIEAMPLFYSIQRFIIAFRSLRCFAIYVTKIDVLQQNWCSWYYCWHRLGPEELCWKNILLVSGKLSKLDTFVHTQTQRVISHLFCGHSLNGMISLQDIMLSPLALRRDIGQVGNIGLNGA